MFFFEAWTMMLVLAMLAWQGGAIDAPKATLEDVRACPTTMYAHKPNHVCLQLTLAGNVSEGNVSGGSSIVVSCKAFASNQARHFPEDFDEASLFLCNASNTTCYAHLEVARAGSSYYAFCVDIAQKNSEITSGVKVKTGEVGYTDAAGAFLLIVYMLWSLRFPPPSMVHETAVSVLAGLVIGFTVFWFTGEAPGFNYHLFNFVILPLVIFDAGFNCHKPLFFKYLRAILAYGVLGTLSIFTIIMTASNNASWYFGEDVFRTSCFELFDKFFQRSCHEAVLPFDTHDRLLIAAVLASTDTVAPLAFIDKALYPHIFAVVFGEGVFNDVVAILLSQVVGESDAVEPGPLLLKLLKIFGLSSIIGAAFGLGIACFFKKFKWSHKGTVHPTALMILLNFICYIVTEMLELSPIFSLFLCAMMCGHYAQESFRHEASEFADEIAEFFAYLAESFVFGHFGFTAVGYIWKGNFSIRLILFYNCCIFVARFFSVALIRACGQLIGIHYKSYGWNSVVSIALAGCMRGTIAFALILRAVPEEKFQTPTHQLMVSTVLGIVMLNCMVFGGLGLFPLSLRKLKVAPSKTEEGEPVSAEFDDKKMGRFVRWWYFVDTTHLRPFLTRLSTPTEGSERSESKSYHI